jgi:N-acyl-D-amino-acid deacylase
MSDMLDVIIRNGTVIDGTGAPRFRADVGISGDRIETVDNLEGAKARKVIDAKGKVVCPGIVDPHSHADLTIYRRDHVKTLAPLVRQGITTFIGGNCGMSMAPVHDNGYTADIKLYLEAFTAKNFDTEIKWDDTASFMRTIERHGALLNVGLLAPHGLIRINAMGRQNRYATGSEVKQMQRVLEECMEAGALGLSTGLQYQPGLQSNTRELIELGKVLKKYDGIYTSHLRSYMNTLPEAVNELVRVASVNGIRAQISHIFWVPDLGVMAPLFHKVMRGLINLSKYWTPPIPLDGEVTNQLEILDKLRVKGVQIGMDVMPTTTSFTHLFAFFPPWAVEGTKEQVIARIADPQKRKEMVYDIKNGAMNWPHTGRNAWSLNLLKIMGWDTLRIMSVVTEKNKQFEGKALPEIAELWKKEPFDCLCDLLLEEDGKVLVFISLGEPEDSLTERSMYAAIKHPEVSVSTDTILMGFGKPSYLFYGCYPKFIRRYVKEMKLLNLEAAIRKMTSLPADHFRLDHRGKIKQGWYADVLVFNPDTIAPNCDFEHPSGVPAGIEQVFINGNHVVEFDKLHTDVLSGRVLRRN